MLLQCEEAIPFLSSKELTSKGTLVLGPKETGIVTQAYLVDASTLVSNTAI